VNVAFTTIVAFLLIAISSASNDTTNLSSLSKSYLNPLTSFPSKVTTTSSTNSSSDNFSALVKVNPLTFTAELPALNLNFATS
jgi:hypothetical protein